MREGIDFVVCRMCQKHFKRITNTHLKRFHNIVMKEYAIKFPKAPIEVERKVRSTRMAGVKKSAAAVEKMKETKRRNSPMYEANSYRHRALDHYGLVCMRCGESFSKKQLVVHHKDLANIPSELGNYSLDNLLVLCKICYAKLHDELSKKIGRFVGLSHIERGMHLILKGLKLEFGLKIKDQHFIGTPKRVARAYAEIFEGVKNTDKQIEDILSTAFKSNMDQMIVVKDIHSFSMCPHHFLPVEMYIDVAYIPNGYVLGISKLPRLVEILAKRPVIQEQLTEEIAQYLMSIKASGAAVRVRGQHFCMRMRGVRKPEAVMVTTTVLGAFREDQSTRNEFLNHIQNSKNF